MFSKITILTLATTAGILLSAAPGIAGDAAPANGNSAAAAANPTSNPTIPPGAPPVGQSPGLAAPGEYGLSAKTPPTPPPSEEDLRPAHDPVTDPEEIAKEKKLNNLFDDIDKDRNGQINEVEYSAYHQTQADDPGFRTYDKDHDVAITRAEFEARNTIAGKIIEPKQ